MTPWIAALQTSLSFTISQSLLKFMSIESVLPSKHLIFCCPLLLLPSIFPSIKVFSNESALHMRWQKYWSFSFSISPASEYSGLISCRGPASAGSRGYPQDERCQQEREKTHETSLDRAKFARERERQRETQRERERERKNDQMGVFAGSGRVWQCFIFYHGFYTLN